MKIGAGMAVLVIFSASVALAAGDAAAGKAVYDKSCKTCHGASGVANPGIVKMMNVEIKDLSSTALSDADVKKIITEGRGKMKPVKTVAGKDSDDVIAFVRT